MNLESSKSAEHAWAKLVKLFPHDEAGRPVLRPFMPVEELGLVRYFVVILPTWHTDWRLVLRDLFYSRCVGNVNVPKYGQCLCRRRGCVTHLSEKDDYDDIVGWQCGARYGRIAPGEQTYDPYAAVRESRSFDGTYELVLED
jgi:hypothetical protein